MSSISLTCPFCREYLKDPVLLACGHSICTNCARFQINFESLRKPQTKEAELNRLVASQHAAKIVATSIPCVACGKLTELGDEGLKPSAEAKAAVEALPKKDQKPPLVTKCPTHSAPLDQYCLECKTPVCETCLSLEECHKDHNSLRLSDHASTCLSELQQGSLDLKRHAGNIELAKIAIGTTADETKEFHARFEERVRVTFSQMIKILQDRSAELITHSRFIRDSKLKNLSDQTEALKSTALQMMELSKTFERCAKVSRDPSELVQATQHMEKLMQVFDPETLMVSPCEESECYTSLELGTLPKDISKFGIVSRQTAGTRFKYMHDFDENGILYWLGTDGDQQKEWANPAISGKITVTRTSDGDGKGGDVRAAAGRTAVSCYTHNLPNQAFTFDFGERYAVIPNYYTLRTWASDSFHVRKWRLEGSVDGQNWFLLRNHVNDTSLSASGASASWPIENCSKPCRFFRILQTGPNSSGHNYLMVSGFEVYGLLFQL